MLRRDVLSLLAAASVTPAAAEEADSADAALSEDWTRRVRDYVAAVNRAIETKADKYPDPIGAPLTRRVYDRIKALQAKGWSPDRVRALFPFQADAVTALIRKRQVRIFKTGFGQDGVWFCHGDFEERPTAWIAEAQGLRRLASPANIQTIGASKDGRTLAVLTPDMTVSLCEPDFTVRAETAFRLPASFTRNDKTLPAFQKPGDVDTLIPFDDGRALLVSGHGGQFLLRGEEVISLELSGSEPRYDMTHIDLSRDQKRIAVGHQNSYHYVLDPEGKVVGKLEPASEYPHCAIFNDAIQQVAFNSCHFYNGRTLGLDYAAFSPTDARSEGDAGVAVLNDSDRAYAGVAYRDGYIWGHAYGYVRHVDRAGKTRWHHHVGGTITWLAINADETLLAVSTYAGFVVLIDLASAGQNELAIGDARFRDVLRYVVTKDGPPVRW